MFAVKYLRNIIHIALAPLDWWSHDAEELLLMTSAHESKNGRYLKQIGGGPALGIYQMEPNTLIDNYNNWLKYHPKEDKLISAISGVSGPDNNQLQFNPIYATIHARLKYYRDKNPLPSAADPWAMAEYAKDIYNSHLGEAKPEDYFFAYRDLVLI